jgi:hypothetical protein
MRARNGWLFPMMVLAAASVTVFGCIGIAAITGHLPLAKVSVLPMATGITTDSSLEAMAPSLGNPQAFAVSSAARALPDAQVAATADAKGAVLKKRPSPQ